jgi:hypothetical protein
MKKIIYSVIIGLLVITSCTGIKTLSTGSENESYLNFIGKPMDYRGGVDVTLDDKSTFKADVNKDDSDHPKGKVYSIANGKHIITVSYNQKIIYKQQIFVSSQETKKIMLP